ncbi:MAG: FHA domain-containing protein [Planctomycetota bacterium]|jgi:hypothetical protein
MSEAEALIEITGDADLSAGPGKFLLRVRRPAGAEETMELGNSTVSIGRAEANDIHADDRQLSRFHARIAFENGAWAITDLSSKNGTTVNGKEIDRSVLQHGDLVQVGETVIVFERDENYVPPEPAAGVGSVADEQLDALLGFGEMIACAEDELSMLDEFVGRMRDVVRTDRCIVYLVEEGQSKPLMQYSSEDTATGDAEEQTHDVVIERAMAADEPAIEMIDGPLPRHLMLVPLNSRYRKMGVLVLERGTSTGEFSEGDLRLVAIAASHVTSFLRSVI